MAARFHHLSDAVAGRLLCFVGGIVDAGGYVLLKGLFAASVTGNIIKMIDSVTEPEFGAAALACTLAYGFGSSIARWIYNYLKTTKTFSNNNAAMVLFMVEFILLLVATASGVCLRDRIDHAEYMNEWPVIVQACLIGIPMGVQVGTAITAFKGYPNSTGMTAAVYTVGTCTHISLIYSLSFPITPA
jgi:uncharacterized membrane protein YoaK (UPF0700 family)